MKIKDVIAESLYDTLTRYTQPIKAVRARAQTKKNIQARDQLASQQTATAAPHSPTAAELGAQNQQSSWIKTQTGVQLLPASAEHPTMARYNKQVYSLTDAGTWIDLRDRPVGATLSTLLNQALEQT